MGICESVEKGLVDGKKSRNDFMEHLKEHVFAFLKEQDIILCYKFSCGCFPEDNMLGLKINKENMCLFSFN